MSDNVVKGLWQEYLDWNHTSIVGKAAMKKGRSYAFWLALAGAALATASGQADHLPGIPEGSEAALARWTGVASAALVGVAALLGRELLTPEREQAFARSRMRAEAFLREVWRFRLRVPPYDQPAAASQLLMKQVEVIVESTGTGLLKVPRPAAGEPGESWTPDYPEVESADDYATHRVDEQMRWYLSKSARLLARSKRVRAIMIALSAASVAAGSFAILGGWAAAVVPLLTTVSGLVLTMVQSQNLGERAGLYQETAAKLAWRKALWLDRVEGLADDETGREVRRTADIAFVEDCEAAMASENESWRAGWMSEEQAQRVLDELESLQGGE